MGSDIWVVSSFPGRPFAFSSPESPKDSLVEFHIPLERGTKFPPAPVKIWLLNVTPNSHKSLLRRNTQNFHVSTIKKENNSKGDLCTCFFSMKTFQEVYCIKILISIRKHILSSAIRPREAASFLNKQLTNEDCICLYKSTCDTPHV